MNIGDDLSKPEEEPRFDASINASNNDWQYHAQAQLDQIFSNVHGNPDLHKPEEHLDKCPDLVSFDTPHSFEVTINGDNNNWQYHTQLEKIFIKMNAVMNVNISFKPLNQVLFLRAMILYSNPNEMHLPVRRCANHKASDCGENVHHILKCCHPKAQYHGLENGQIFRDRLSIVVPLVNPRLDDDGVANEPINLEFACQNSCTSGINRKATCIVFTLENQDCKILGKKVIQFKVCSCPKRDADRELGNPIKRKPGDEHKHPRGKKPKVAVVNGTAVQIKTEPDEESDPPASAAQESATNEEIEIKVRVPNIEVGKAVLACTFNTILGHMALDKKNPPDSYLNCAEYVKKQQKELNNKNN